MLRGEKYLTVPDPPPPRHGGPGERTITAGTCGQRATEAYHSTEGHPWLPEGSPCKPYG